MSFEIIPVDEIPEKERHTYRKSLQERINDRKDKPLKFEEVWQTGWMLFKQGTIFRFKQIGATEMVQPVTTNNGNWGSKKRPVIKGCNWAPHKIVRVKNVK